MEYKNEHPLPEVKWSNPFGRTEPPKSMTVGQLIKALQSQPDNMPLAVMDDGFMRCLLYSPDVLESETGQGPVLVFCGSGFEA